jgi:hypothetical protein
MPNIIGEPFPDYVNKQINIRQTAHGSGINTFRTPNQLAYLNSKTAWVKLASSVKIDSKFETTDPKIAPGSWDNLAKKNVLFSGISSLSGKILRPKSTVEKKYEHSSGFGFVPMPGIIDASVKCENRGSIKKATVNIKCYSPEQFRILEVLYLRLGYTLFLEWGWSNYLDNNGKLHPDYSTLIESSFFNLNQKSKYTSFLKNIEAYRAGKDGNYDGLLCKVSNFSWNFSADGSYDIQLTLISMGDVIESLKTNVTPSKDIVEYITKVYSLYGDETNDGDNSDVEKKTPPAPANDLISAYFFLQKTFVADKELNLEYWKERQVNFGIDSIDSGDSKVASIFIKQSEKFDLTPKAEKTDFLYFSYNTLEDDEDTLHNEGFYVRFGHLIEFIKENLILKIEGSKDRIIEIDEDFENAKMYVFPYQVSLDPRVCIVGTNEKLSRKIFYKNLKIWNDGEGNGANIANIYLNCAMVSRVLGEKQDEEGNISLYEVLSTICSELNLALGSVNNLETIIDEEINSIKIIDANYQPPITKESAELQLYGYNDKNSNFVHNFDLKTEITNDFATMVSIGSTAGGYAKGMENTMFSKWNKGLIDIFKENYTPPKQTSTEKDTDPPNVTYASEFWLKLYAPYGLTFPQDIEYDVSTPDACAISPEIIDKNLVLVPEFYKYCQYKIQQKEQKYASPTNGFIPISLGITLEGISGIKIYNYLKVDTRFLPSNYPDNLKFIIKGVNHKISANNWETSLETVVIANSSDKNGKPFKSYHEIKEIVDEEITAGKQGIKSNENNIHQEIITPPSTELLATSESSGTGTAASSINGKGNKTLGTAGPDASPDILSSDALSKDTIETLVRQSGAADTSRIRARIIKVAASYVGQFESLPPQNPGWYDPDYQDKFQKSNPKLKDVNWFKGQPWCAWFCQLVWREAYNTGNKYVNDWDEAITPGFKAQYKDIWDNYLSAGGTITAGVSNCRDNFQRKNKFITMNDALTGRSLPQPGDIAVYGGSHVDLVVKPFVSNDGKLTGFSSIGGNTGKANLKNGGETKYYERQGSWKSVVGFCKVIDIYNKDINYTTSPPVNLPPSISTPTSTTSTPTLNQLISQTIVLDQEIQKESARGFNNLTYRLSLIYRLKDNYGRGNVPGTQYLFYDAKGGNDDELKAVKLLEQWLENQTQKVELEKLTDKDKKEFSNYKDLLISRTKTRGNDVTFQSKHNDKVKKVTIDPNF